ncbi:ribonuclease Z [Nocardioides sp. TF02-7]|uniref:ribonuclease Z n=1 Tax=Nocardioides sp. TF02-7 TaxID=2917724 RepID=UPI001F06CABB|nr:ribonuclease Z [Nocardioides sp. TF02-7]UMG92123.1 ribonuclease Z [Nocardioides sp. TF02-7]
MTVRELVVLGTASQVPTRTRAHHGALLRWDREVVLFDPGEGTQRQLTLAGVSAGSITRICITHLHGDHCLGLPGVLQRMLLDGARQPVDLYYPASGQEYVDRLRRASAVAATPEVREHPVSADGVVDRWPGLTLEARALDHRIDAYGWRLQEPDGRRMLSDRLDALGIAGPAVGELARAGRLEVGGRVVTAEEVSEPRPGQSFAFVMDTRLCSGARELAQGVDLLVTESTFLASEEDLAEKYAHLTAAQAGTLAWEAGVRRLVLTHYSGRHPDESVFEAEARLHHPDVHAARDLDRVPVPPRR